MEKKGVKGLIVDLRDNGGGLVNADVGVADKLLGKELITFTKDKYGNKQYFIFSNIILRLARGVFNS